MLYPVMYDSIVRMALTEDLGLGGDLTSGAVVPENARATALVRMRREGRVAGLGVALSAFTMLDPTLQVEVTGSDGNDALAGATLAIVRGPARSVLSAERTALNILGRMCGIATATRALVRAVDGTRARIACTRKTTPGLRVLEKYAVRMGGGCNHRFRLDDGVLIKDNHLVAAGGVRAAVERARTHLGHMVKIEVEVDTLAQLRELLDLPVDAVLLDNMDPATLREAVALVGNRMLTEASGNVTPATIRSIAEAGVDIISVGGLTHSSPNLDVGLDFESTSDAV